MSFSNEIGELENFSQVRGPLLQSIFGDCLMEYVYLNRNSECRRKILLSMSSLCYKRNS